MEIRKLAESLPKADITLVAGEEGLSNTVSWMQMVENVLATDFLAEGDIAFIIGFTISGTEDLVDLLTHIYMSHASGVMINTGPYINSIPREAVDFCNEKGLPLFEIPWRVRLAEVMHTFSLLLTEEDRDYVEITDAFKSAIFFPEKTGLYSVPLTNRGFLSDWTYTAAVATVKDIDDTEKFDKAPAILHGRLFHHYKNFVVFTNDAQVIAITANYTPEELHAFVAEFKQSLQQYFFGHPLTLGVGKATKSVRCIYKSYRQAVAISDLQSSEKIEPDQIFYSEMGIYKLLMSITDSEILTDYLDSTLAPLISYDREHNEDYLNLLKVYLKNDGSVKQTADDLYIHRNTVNYRLKKIEEMTGYDLSSNRARLELTLAIMILDFI